jgi:hypothetical protein
MRRERRTKKMELIALRPVSRNPKRADLECQTNKMDEVLPRYQTHGKIVFLLN